MSTPTNSHPELQLWSSPVFPAMYETSQALFSADHQWNSESVCNDLLVQLQSWDQIVRNIVHLLLEEPWQVEITASCEQLERVDEPPRFQISVLQLPLPTHKGRFSKLRGENGDTHASSSALVTPEAWLNDRCHHQSLMDCSSLGTTCRRKYRSSLLSVPFFFQDVEIINTWRLMLLVNIYGEFNYLCSLYEMVPESWKWASSEGEWTIPGKWIAPYPQQNHLSDSQKKKWIALWRSFWRESLCYSSELTEE